MGHPELCDWLAQRHGNGLTADRVMITNGSLEAGWMLFEHLLTAGDTVVVEQPSYDRTLLMLERLASRRSGSSSRTTGSTSPARAGARRRPRAEARPHHPQLPQPGRLHALRGEAPAAGRARRRARLLDLRGRPLPRGPLRRCRGAADDARPGRGHRGQGDPRLLVLQDGQPRRPRRLPGRPCRGDRGARQARQRDLHLTRTCWPSRSSTSSAARAASTRTSSSSTSRWPSVATPS